MKPAASLLPSSIREDPPRRGRAMLCVSRLILLLISPVLFTACGGGGGSGPTPIPQIANLDVIFTGGCTLDSRFAGSLMRTKVSFTDGDGDVAGGKLQKRSIFQPDGVTIDLSFDVPGPSSSLVGDKSGTVSVTSCIRFAQSSNRLELQVTLVDAAGHSSNTLKTTLDRPFGAPEGISGLSQGAERF